ncbi:hypothetical protein TRIUR3_19959 [Triticum urartu]|uniref:RNase H type-1 domain-containing protein n=1 Tax=Triticum urartu TaxID=4572 RepID=M8A088_TRIUA|nr:hypothetical protein TRIUR3_19959 [Triticum urartu]
MENSKVFADKLFGTCRGRGTLSRMKALTRIGSERWNMNIDGMLIEDEVKKVATQMITEKTTAGPFDRPCDSKSSLVQFATTKIRGLVVFLARYSEEFKSAAMSGDHEAGKVLARYSEYSAGAVAGVEEAEAKAALIGLHALKDLQGPTILELDCQIRIKELMTGKQSLSPCYGLLRDIKQALTNFSDHSISSVGRLCNALTDGLAALARNSEDQERIADVPDCLRPLMISLFVVSAE